MALATFARRLWAAPCSLVGLAAGLVPLLLGGRARWDGTALEIAWREQRAHCGPRTGRLRFRAITFGHVIVGVTCEELDLLRAYEHVHVRQYERWGLLFFPAYLASSAWQLLRGRDPYLDNHFEREARRLGH